MLPRIERKSSVNSVQNEEKINMCRICLKAGDIAIFGESDLSRNVVEFAAITINKYDNFPKYICNKCNLLLEAAVVFRKTAKKSDQILHSIKASDIDDSSEYSWVVENLLAAKTSNNNSYSDFYEYDNTEEPLFDSEAKDDDTDNLSSDSESSADLKNEREYLCTKFFSEEECDSNNTTPVETVKNDTYIVIVGGENKQENKTDPFTCSNCYTSFKTIGELENHTEVEHNIKLTDKVNCAVCNEVVSKSFYKVHMKLHREKYLEKKKPPRKVECKICNKKFNRTYYKQHLKIHSSDNDKTERMRYCTLCRKSLNMGYYNDHMRRIHKLGPNGEKLQQVQDKRKLKHVQCPVCDKKIIEENYKIHLAHHGKPPKKYICEHCAKEFIHPSAFKTHCLTHGGEFKYKCEFCPYRAQHLALLKVHVRTHTGDYIYKCTECPAKFITKSNLNQHCRRHEGPGNIKCHDCDKVFYRMRNMEEHYKTIHLNIKDVLCTICGKGFSNRDRMLSHQIKVHNREKLLPRVPSYLKARQDNSRVHVEENELIIL